MTASINAVAQLVTAMSLLLAAVFLLRMVKPLSAAIALLAERRASKAVTTPIARMLRDRVRQVLEHEQDGE